MPCLRIIIIGASSLYDIYEAPDELPFMILDFMRPGNLILYTTKWSKLRMVVTLFAILILINVLVALWWYTSQPGYLGINYTNPYGSDPKGGQVSHVREKSPAEKADLKSGDAITHFNGIETLTGGDLDALIKKAKTGDEIKLKVEREGKSLDMTIQLGVRRQILTVFKGINLILIVFLIIMFLSWKERKNERDDEEKLEADREKWEQERREAAEEAAAKEREKRRMLKEQLEAAKSEYEIALCNLQDDSCKENKIRLLETGRRYAEAAGELAGHGGVALFDEVALQNDLTAYGSD